MGFLKSSKGFTLLEITGAILIASLLLLPAIKLYNITREKNNLLETKGNMISIARAINIFVSENNRYPIPSNLLLSQNDAGFGVEGPAPSGPTIPASLPAIPVCPDMTLGMCITGSATPTLIGAVPFDVLQIGPKKSLDMWSNKIFYAVTASQTDVTTYTQTGGGEIDFTALDSFTGAVIPLTVAAATGDSYTDFDMILISTGPTGKGGYTADGVLIEPCITVGNPENEDENCDFLDDVFMIDKNKRSDPDTPFGPPYTGTMNPNDNGTRNLISGPNFYDDITYEQEFVPTDYWNENQSRNQTIVSNVTRVGIGTNNPVNEVHVIGDLTVSGGNQLRTVMVCNPGSSNCLEPKYVAGFENSMNCNTNILPGLEPVIGFDNESVVCGSTADTSGAPILGTDTFKFTSNIVATSCAAGQVMQGMNASGNPICVVP